MKIAVELLDNPNYGEKTFTVSLLEKGSSESETLFTYSATTFGTNNVSVGDKGGLNWTSYDLTATITFAGETVSRTNTHYITGLPYDSPNFLNTSITMKSSSDADVTSWVANGNVEYWSGRGYQLIYYYLGDVEAGNIFSPAFQVPESTNIKYSTPVCYFTTGLGTPTMDVYTGVTSSYTKVRTATTSIKRNNSNSNPGIGKFTTVSKEDILVSNGRISISTDEEKDINAAENWFTVASLSVRYR